MPFLPHKNSHNTESKLFKLLHADKNGTVGKKNPEASETERRKSRARPMPTEKCGEAIFDKSLAKRKSRMNCVGSAFRFFLPSSRDFRFFFFSRVWNHWTMKIMSLVWLNNIAWNGYQYPVASGKTSHRISDDAICTDHLFVMWSPANKFWFDKQITAKMRRRKKWNTRTDERDPARRAPSSLSRL